MRETWFRGKRVDNGEWVHGDLMHEYVHHGTNTTIVKGGCVYIEVVPETVGQFTGLTDKNGKEIYEGDIFRTRRHTQKKCLPWRKELKEVIFHYGSFTGRYFNEDGIVMYGCLTALDWDKEVIGNIHENPELLEDSCK